MARTDDDTWDLATSVGATATMVAAGRARATRDGLIDDPFAEPLVRAVGVDFFTRWAAGELDAADVDVPGAAWGMQRMTDMLTARTRYIDAFFAEAGAAGIRQVVILASGLDARAYRLPWPAGTTVFEIDQPRVLEFKAATIAQLGAEPSRLTCATTGRRRCGRRASTSGAPPPGPPRGSSASCRRRPRIGCWTTSPRCPPTAASWWPRSSPTPAPAGTP